MELYQLRSLVAVAELGQLTRAAEMLHLSQPAITAQIRALEDEFEVILFVRTPSGMVLTKAGQRLVAQAEIVLAAAQGFKNEAKTFSGEIAGKVSIGTVCDPAFIRLGDLLNAMMERFPLIELDLHQQVSGIAFERVREGALDASFYFGELGSGATGVAGLELRDIVYRVAAPAAWKDQVADASWAQIAALPWALAPAISTHNQMLRELFRDQGAEPIKVVEADQESVINSLVISGVGVSLMREDQARAAQTAGEVVIWGKARLTTKLWLIYRAEQASDPLISALIEVVREMWPPKAKRAQSAAALPLKA